MTMNDFSEYLDEPCPHCGHTLLRLQSPHVVQCDLCGTKYNYQDLRDRRIMEPPTDEEDE